MNGRTQHAYLTGTCSVYSAKIFMRFTRHCSCLPLTNIVLCCSQSVSQPVIERDCVGVGEVGTWTKKPKKELFAFRIPKTVQRCYDVAEIVEVGGIVGFYLICPI